MNARRNRIRTRTLDLRQHAWTRTLVAAAALLAGLALLAGCASSPEAPDGAAEVRASLNALQSDAALGPLAPEAIAEAEAAVQIAEASTDVRPEVASHRVYVADRKVEIARALAQARHAEQERAALVAQREEARLAARTREAERARLDADLARADAQSARLEADAARTEAQTAYQETVELQREIEQLQARPTDRGLVLTLGDVLFETGRADLKPGSVARLDQLADFMQRHPERSVVVEGHTDSVGSDESNLLLSQRRAESVKAYLLRRGLDPSRVTTTGLGESMPVASNDDPGGRQQNRRVEIVVSHADQQHADQPIR
jgi:outer membrane protein OmpA-like peptidoglycan-associated protein